MARKSLKEIAESDRQVARFLERADDAELAAEKTQATTESPKDIAARLAYAQNHLPKGRNISPEAQEAISACILG